MSIPSHSTLAGAIGDRWGTSAIFVAMGVLLVPAVVVGLLLPPGRARPFPLIPAEARSIFPLHDIPN